MVTQLTRRHCLATLLLILTLGTSLPAQESKSAPLKVFILAGQSNMQGHARTTTIDYIGEDPATAPLLKRMKRKDGQPRVVEQTFISYLTGGRGKNGEGSGPLTVGYGARKVPAEASDKIGPEYLFGITMQESLRQPILIIKTAWGGKSLHTDFRPPSAGAYEFSEAEKESLKKRNKNVEEEIEKRRKASGVYYRYMIDHVRHVLGDIKRVCPAYDAEAGYEIAGFVWFQGWNDLVARDVYPQRGQPGGYDRYSEWMATFIRDVRKDLKTPKMPFVIGVLGVNGPIENVGERHRAVHGNFRKAMAAPASLEEFRGNVAAVETGPFWDMDLEAVQQKFGQVQRKRRQLQARMKKGEITREELNREVEKFRSEVLTPEEISLRERAASNAAYHYYGSAKIMAQIGQAFAEAMLKLQPRSSSL